MLPGILYQRHKQGVMQVADSDDGRVTPAAIRRDTSRGSQQRRKFTPTLATGSMQPPNQVVILSSADALEAATRGIYSHVN
jgi:hypothetical protein